MLAQIVSIFLGYIFLNSAAAKAVGRRAANEHLRELLPAMSAVPGGGIWLAIALETCLAAVFLWPLGHTGPLLAAIVVVGSYSVLLAWRLGTDGPSQDCGCGGGRPTPRDWSAVGRNALLNVFAVAGLAPIASAGAMATPAYGALAVAVTMFAVVPLVVYKLLQRREVCPHCHVAHQKLIPAQSLEVI